MTLEEAIRTALEFENKVREVYRMAEERATTPKAKGFFRVLGDEEQDHVAYLDTRLKELIATGEITLDALKTVIPERAQIEAKISGLSKTVAQADETELSMLDRALEVASGSTSRSSRSDVEEKTVTVPKISCGHCVASITREVSELDGVSSVEGDADTREVTFRWSPPASWEGIRDLLADMGYLPEGD